MRSALRTCSRAVAWGHCPPSTGRVDVEAKRDGYAALGIPEYWRFDETGRRHGTRLAGDRSGGRGLSNQSPLRNWRRTSWRATARFCTWTCVGAGPVEHDPEIGRHGPPMMIRWSVPTKPKPHSKPSAKHEPPLKQRFGNWKRNFNARIPGRAETSRLRQPAAKRRRS